jgi:hypothetical protein
MAFKQGDKLYHPEFGHVKFDRYSVYDGNHSFVSGGKCPKGTSVTKVLTADLTTVVPGKSGSLSRAIQLEYDLFDASQEPPQPFDAMSADPKALELFLKLFDEAGEVVITSSPSYAPTIIAELAGWMNETDLGIAASYVNTYTEKCHAAKFDVVIPNSKVLKGEGVDYKLNLNFNTNGNMAQQGIEIQIGSKSLAEYLRRGAIPQQASPRRRSARV